MTPRERRQYDAMHSTFLTLQALQEFNRAYISVNLAKQFEALQQALKAEMQRIRDNADIAEQARRNAANIPM